MKWLLPEAVFELEKESPNEIELERLRATEREHNEPNCEHKNVREMYISPAQTIYMTQIAAFSLMQKAQSIGLWFLLSISSIVIMRTKHKTENNFYSNSLKLI